MKTLSRLFIMTSLLCAVHGTASAQGICRVYEYAELKDLPKEKLLDMYCFYGKAMRGMIDVAISEIKAGRTGASQRANRESIQCSQEQDRVERVLLAQHGVKKPDCETK